MLDMWAMQIRGVDPGWDNIYTASSATRYTGPDYKSTVRKYTSKQYFQDSHTTTSNAKIRKWQQDDQLWRDIVTGLATIKSTRPEAFKVSNTLAAVCVFICIGAHLCETAG